MRWIVTFDVPDDRARRQLTRRLERHGTRVLYSVFEIEATPTQLDGVLRAARPLIGDSGQLLALPHCADCVVAQDGPDLEPLPHGWVISR